MKLRMLMGAGLGALALQGCGTVSNLGATGLAESIEDNAATLNDAHTRAMTAIIAKNVLRARDRWPTNYTTLSGIRSNPGLSLGGSASLSPLGFGNPLSTLSTSAASVSRNETANAEYSVNPFANNDKTQSLLKPIQPEVLRDYWNAGWPRETLMWLFADSVTFAGETRPWRIDGDEFSSERSAEDVAYVPRYEELVERARRGDVIFDKLPTATQDERKCSPYDPVYLRETLGVREETMSASVSAIEALTGKKLILAPDTRAARNEAYVAPDAFNRRLMLCETVEQKWGLIDAASGAALAEVQTRSFDDMIYFLGETLRNGTQDTPVVIGGVVLFRTYPTRDGKEYAVRVEHADEVHFIAPQNRPGGQTGPRDVTGNVLSLLNQLFLLAQSDEFLRAPESRLR